MHIAQCVMKADPAVSCLLVEVVVRCTAGPASFAFKFCLEATMSHGSLVDIGGMIHDARDANILELNLQYSTLDNNMYYIMLYINIYIM